MFLHKGEIEYVDVLERTLYNALLSGLSLSGDRFFYSNRLESRGKDQRQEWFGCACCPSNITRFIPSVPGYIYAKTNGRIYINLYADNTAGIDLNGKQVEIIQQTSYPWDGQVKVVINPQVSTRFGLYLRVPGWARNEAIPGNLYSFTDQSEEKIILKVNGEEQNAKLIRGGYLILNRKWKTGDTVELVLPMPVRKIEANEKVADDRGKIAIQRGPLVYCAEWPDASDGHVLDLVVDPQSQWQTFYDPELLNGVEIITGSASKTSKTPGDEVVLQQPGKLVMIPYYAWANRGAGEMVVWIPIK
jgi:DUF1680 family protein